MWSDAQAALVAVSRVSMQIATATMDSDLIAKAGACAGVSAWTALPQAPKLAGPQPARRAIRWN
jgi:hypothetical protein